MRVVEPDRERGVALLMVIFAVFLLSVAVLETRAGVRLFETIAYSSASELQTQYIARSGLVMVQAALEEDDNREMDSYEDDWAAANDFGTLPVGDNGWIVVRVDDEAGKLRVSDLVDAKNDQPSEEAEFRFAELLQALGITEARSDEIIDSLIDWIDENSTVTGAGAENSYYENLPAPYTCPNSEVRTPGELALVKGIGNQLLFRGEGETPPLLRFVTIYGDGKVNVNTAPKEVLMALHPDLDEELAEEIMKSREEDPFDSIPDLKNVPGFPETLAADEGFNNLVTFKSSYFSAEIIGESERSSSRARGVFHRTVDGARLVYYRGF